MTTVQDGVDEQVSAGRVPGAVALLADERAGTVEVAAGGVRTVGGEPMTRDTLFRIASITKPITAAATMALVDRGRFGLDDPAATWLPELDAPSVLRRPDGDLDDVVPADGPITVRHLLTSTSGHGFPADLDVPVVERLFADLHQGPPRPALVPPPDEWMARLAALPLLAQPGERFLYNTPFDVLGVLLARAERASLGDVLADTLFGPLGMVDTGFVATDIGRMASSYRAAAGTEADDEGDGDGDGDEGGFALVDPPDGQWASAPAFASGAGGLVSTVDDWCAFGRMLLAEGEGPGGAQVLSAEAVRLMTTSHVEGEPGNPFLQDEGWGFGGGVDLRVTQPWTVPGRYGWVGGTGTAGYVIPSRGTVAVWMGQVELGGPDDFSALAAFLTWAAER